MTNHQLPDGPFHIQLLLRYCAGVPGLEPRLTEPESAGLPITPYPTTILSNLSCEGKVYLTRKGALNTDG